MFSVSCIVKHHVRPLYKVQTRTASTLKERLLFLFKRHLGIVNSVASGAFMGLGDLIEQEIEHYYKMTEKRYNWGRVSRMFAVGCFIGPLHHLYYMKLDIFLPGSTLKDVIKKVLADQFIASPLTIVAFFYSMGILEKKSLQECTNELTHKFFYVYTADWCFWPPVQFINFYYLPWQYRVMYINIVTMIFNVFLSHIKHDVQ